MTLIEALIASILLGVGVAGLMSATTLALRNQQRSEQRSAALYVAAGKLAEIEAAGPYVWSLNRPNTGSQMQGGVTYEWEISIKQRAIGELFTVHVKVNWSVSDNIGNVELETWMNDYASGLTNQLGPAAMGPQT